MQRKDGRKISRDALEAYRMRAVKLRYNLGYSVTEIAVIFDLNYHSISRWFCKHRAGGEEALKRTFAPGAKRTLTPKVLKWLENALTKPATKWGFETPLWTAPMVRTLIEKEQKISIDRTTVWRYLCSIGLSFQKPQKRYIEQNRKLVEEWIREEWPKIKTWVAKHNAILYFEDESGIAITPVIGKTWAKKGNPPIIRVTGKRGGVLAMSAISPGGNLRFRLEKRKINADVMIEFLEQIAQSHKNRKVAVVMDQAKPHTAKKVRNYAEEHKRLKVFYIPARSPELNPDEKVWRHLKHVSLKNHGAQDKNELTRIVLGALRSMQKSPKLTSAFFDNYLT